MRDLLVISSTLLWVVVIFNLLLTMALVRRISGFSVKNADGNLLEYKVIELAIGEPAVPFAAENINGDIVTLSSFYGHMVILIFIMTQCSACRAGIPSYLDLGRRARKKGIEFVFVSLGEKEKAQTLANEFNINFPVLVATKENSFESDYKVRGIPSYCLIDEQGLIKSAGFMSELIRSLNI